MAKTVKRREWTKDDVRELKNSRLSKNAGSKDREGAKKNRRRYRTEGVHARCLIGFKAIAHRAVVSFYNRR